MRRRIRDGGSDASDAKPLSQRDGEREQQVSDAAPAVKTTEEIEMQVEQLNVRSVTATGGSCPVQQ